MPQEPRTVLLMSYCLDAGGTERQLTELAKGLDRSRFSPHVATFHPQGVRKAELDAAGVPVFAVPVTSLKSPHTLRYAWTLRRYIQRHNIALVHPFDVPTVLFGVPAARLARTVVLSSQRGERTLFSSLYQRGLKITDRLVDGIVVNCDFIRRALQADGVREDHIHICYNGIDTSTFHPAPTARRPELSGASCVIGTVAVLRPEKRLDTLIEAFARIRPEHPGLKLVIVGGGELEFSLQQQAAAAGAQADCIFHRATRDVADWYRSFDIFVLPSISEALSNSLLEAMACGCCPVASDVGGNPEIVRDGCNGLLFEKGDASELASKLRMLIHDRELRGRLASRAVDTVQERFRLDVAVNRMSDIYTRHLNRSTGSGE